MEKTKIFVSHCSKHRNAEIHQLVDELKENFNYDTRIDLEQDFEQEIKESQAFIMCFSNAYFENEICEKQVSAASLEHKPVVAVRVGQHDDILGRVLGDQYIDFCDEDCDVKRTAALVDERIKAELENKSSKPTKAKTAKSRLFDPIHHIKEKKGTKSAEAEDVVKPTNSDSHHAKKAIQFTRNPVVMRRRGELCYHCWKPLRVCYQSQKGRKICARCKQVESLKCWKCERYIRQQDYEGEIPVTQNGMTHPECFSCDACFKSLLECYYYRKDGGFFCAKCLDNRFAPECHRCKQVILQSSKGENVYQEKKKYYHFECLYVCDICHRSLINKKHYPEDGHRFCTRCYNKAEDCKGCRDKILLYSRAENQIRIDNECGREFWHESCYKKSRKQSSWLPQGLIKSSDGKFAVQFLPTDDE